MPKDNVFVWMRIGSNEWRCVTNVPMRQSSAETMAVLLTFEHAVEPGDLRFTASSNIPASMGWRESKRDEYFASLITPSGGPLTDFENTVLGRSIEAYRSINSFGIADAVFNRLRDLDYVDDSGYATVKGVHYHRRISSR